MLMGMQIDGGADLQIIESADMGYADTGSPPVHLNATIADVLYML